MPTPHIETAVAFASALVAADFPRAHAMLTPELQTELSPVGLREQLYGMFTGYAEGDPTEVHFDEGGSLSEWPGKEPGDLGWAYVSITGESFVEGVAVVVAEVDGTPLIRSVEWGRP
jgi:hypothetical protein